MRIVKVLLVLLLLADLIYSYAVIYKQNSLDGDVPAIVTPAESYKKVMADPFGFSVIKNGEKYAATNRFFIHQAEYTFFRTMPFFFQHFTDPVESVYLSMAFARFLFHLLIIFFLSALISGTTDIRRSEFLLSAFLITPLMQINGYHDCMSLTLNSTTYTFFYSLPLIFILAYLYPFVRKYIHKKDVRFNFLLHTTLVGLSLLIAFGGPTAGPIMLLICPGALLFAFFNNFNKVEDRFWNRVTVSLKRIPTELLLHFLWITMVSLYSFYIGRFNSENDWATIPLSERYQLLPAGFAKVFFEKLAFPSLSVMIIINLILMRAFQMPDRKLIYRLCGWLMVFIIVYVLLLPLGGYRSYRPLIIRHDTFSPVTVAMMFLYGFTTYFVLKLLSGRKFTYYFILIITMTFIFTNADRYEPKRNNYCDKALIYEIAKSPETVVPVRSYCLAMAWSFITDPDQSINGGKLMKFWKITAEEKKYYYLPDSKPL